MSTEADFVSHMRAVETKANELCGSYGYEPLMQLNPYHARVGYSDTQKMLADRFNCTVAEILEQIKDEK